MTGGSVVLTNARLWDGISDHAVSDVTVRVDDGLIRAIDARPPDSEAGVVDLHGATIVPGLTDLHAHVTTSSERSMPVDNAIYRTLTPNPEKLLHGIRNMLRSLAAGFTTLRVMGHRGVGEPQLRDFIDQGLIIGPRLKVAPWPISMTGGRGDLFWPASVERDPVDTADGVDACRKMVRLQRKLGADFIKVTASGGMLSGGDRPHWPNYTVAELSAIAEEAHTYDMKVAAHAHSAEGVKRSLMAGIDTIEHGSFLDDECIEMMVARGAFLVPTLSINRWILERGKRTGVTGSGLAKVEEAGRRQVESVQKAISAGVKIALGTDSTGTICPFGHHALELELYVECGMTPVEALATGTRVASEALGLEHEQGTVTPGKIADLVVVDGDPTVDITLLRKPGAILHVYRRGVDVTDPWPFVTAAMRDEENLF